MDVINIHITNKCNYNCTHCFGKFSKTKKELDFEEACKVVDNIAQYFSKQSIAHGRINLAGGEPLLCPFLDDLIKYIYDRGIKVSIITNGSLLTKERINRWENIVYCIGLSIDSKSSKTNVAIGRCCNNKTLSGRQAVRLAKAIHGKGIKLKINTVVSKLNANENMAVFYERLKPDRLKLIQMEVVNGINDDASQYQISKEAFDEFCKRHKKCCSDTVCEQSSSLENSYLMVNPQGEVLLNDGGKYETYGNCLEKDLDDILKLIPFNIEKFNERYDKENKSET